MHIFADGNGRTGWLWQSLIFQKWKEVFVWISIETLVHENQEGYYKVLQRADIAEDSTEIVYKDMQLKDKLPTMSEEEQLRLLAANGMLVKRPIVVDGHKVLVGFKEAEWEEKLL